MRSSGTGTTGEPFASVKSELRRLRQGVGLADTEVVAAQPVLHQLICGGPAGPRDSANQVSQIQQAVRAAINGLVPDLRKYALVDFNPDGELPGGTLTSRQEDLAREQHQVVKTVRRHATKALDALAVALVSSAGETSHVGTNPSTAGFPLSDMPQASESWQETLCTFWGLKSGGSVDIVCSEIPDGELPSYASEEHHNYLYYARFVDLDSLIYVGRAFVRAQPTVDINEVQPSQYSRRGTNPLLVLGGTYYNQRFEDYQSQLDIFEIKRMPAGVDDPLVIGPGVKPLAERRFGPRWTSSNKLLTDVSVFVRRTFGKGNKVFLAAGCLTLGVHGAARCFLHGEEGASNARYIDEMAGGRDFVLVAEVGHGGPGRVPTVPDFTKTAPLVLITLKPDGKFEDVLVDNTDGKDYQG